MHLADPVQTTAYDCTNRESGRKESGKIKNNAIIKKMGLNKLVLCGILLVMYIFFAVISPTFLKYSRILSALNYAYFLGFLSLGVNFVIATGGIDFSIGPVMFCAALISGHLLTANAGRCCHACWSAY